MNERLTELATTDATAEIQKFKSYKDFVMRSKTKKAAGMKHFKVTPFSTPAKDAAGSD